MADLVNHGDVDSEGDKVGGGEEFGAGEVIDMGRNGKSNHGNRYCNPDGDGVVDDVTDELVLDSGGVML